MYLTKWDPFEALSSLQDDVDRVFNRQLRLVPQGNDKLNRADWLPAVDIHEDQEALYFDFEAPGIDKNAFDIKVENGLLSIRGEKKNESENKGKNFYRVEREYGTFLRSFSLPETADAEKVNAEYKNGVLYVKIAKKEAAKPKKIDVKVS